MTTPIRIAFLILINPGLVGCTIISFSQPKIKPVRAVGVVNFFV